MDHHKGVFRTPQTFIMKLLVKIVKRYFALPSFLHIFQLRVLLAQLRRPPAMKSIPIMQKKLPKIFCKKGVFTNFAKFAGKHLCQSLFFRKVEGVRLC